MTILATDSNSQDDQQTDSNENNSAGLSGTEIAFITISCVAVVGIGIIAGFIFYKKKSQESPSTVDALTL